MNLENDSLTWMGFLALIWMVIILVRISAELKDAIGFITAVSFLGLLGILMRMDKRIRKLEEK